MSTPLAYHHVSKTYPNSKSPAVRDVSLRVKKGLILTLVGESGSGKTTLLRLAAGLEAPDQGEVRIGEEIVASDSLWVPPEKRGIGLVFQDGALFPHLTVSQNICYGIKRWSNDDQSATVDRMLSMVGLSGFNERFPHELSGGERQRLAIARALAPEPKVVLLDEPFSNLDPSLRRSMRDEIRRILNKVEATAILVTHDTDDALAIGDRIAIFRDGEIEQIGTPAEIYGKPKNAYCAQLFGPANHVALNGEKPRWVRPENMVMQSQKERGMIEVQVEEVRDAGRHCEAVVRPLKKSSSQRWIVYCDKAEAGERAWIRL
ncbi:MAG: ABC transporter ATP-binding protein [Verrucomicrobiota bacterium]